MPAKGQKLTEEHKAKMQAALRASEAEARAAEEAALAERQAYLAAEGTQADAEAAEAAAGTIEGPIVEPVKADIAQAVVLVEEGYPQGYAEAVAESPQNTPIPGGAPAPTTAPSAQTQGFSEWGPYDDYTLVTTPYGVYAVEVGYVMTFVPHRYFNNREKREMITHLPVYTNAITGRTRDQDMGLVGAVPDVNVTLP
jgi:hypothetical protein